MAINVTQTHAKHLMERLEGMKAKVANMREKAEETTKKVVRTAEVGGAAFGMGLVQGRTGGVEVFGVPMELGLGLGLNIFALLGGAGEYSEHLNNVGDGCLAAYATTLGRGVGTTMRNKALGGAVAAPAANLPSGQAKTSGVRLSPEEVAELSGIPAR